MDYRFRTLKFLIDGPPNTDPIMLVIMDKGGDKELARLDCASAAGRQSLMRFLYNWGKAVEDNSSHFHSYTTSVTGMLNTPQLSFFYKDYSSWLHATDSGKPLSNSVGHFVEGEPLHGMQALGKAFPKLLKFKIDKDSTGEHGTILVSCSSRTSPLYWR